MSTWLIYALLSAISAAMVAVFGKMGLQHLDANTATAIRAVIMALFLFGVVVVQGKLNLISEIIENRKALFFIALSGIAGALSWLFYFMAIKNGQVSQVAPIDKLSVVFAVIFAVILFGEKISLIAAGGVALITVGALMVALG
ncbi:EamA family transporter [Morganella morganii]|uniref:EamA family transporter n=1 Tax=Morganella morganii TaxID=582 RepID=UPI001BD9C5D8|nr:EamA family transporter [Morganella morganii]EKU0270134.1 EamA family transporter [Morganella morganii]MBT0388685.1 EamA family transporter [Morganella morganii subsp. morganii]MBT0519010.1 EamA family transporter [Morganella morganii subsp. morganii]QWL88746.1 EamA family transporter [Morganella morganii subsp. morganii]HEJ1051147.1 EamA family transporter [Morganella morganii]